MATPNATAVKFGHPASLIREYRHWLVLARPQQVTLGALVLVCTDAARAFSQISVRAFEELAQVTADLDAALTPLLQAGQAELSDADDGRSRRSFPCLAAL